MIGSYLKLPVSLCLPKIQKHKDIDPESSKPQLPMTPTFSSLGHYAFERFGFQCNAEQVEMSEHMFGEHTINSKLPNSIETGKR